MKNLFSKSKILIQKHKVVSLIILIILLVGGYYGYKKVTNTTGETRYLTTKVKSGTIISSITGSGQVSALNQIDLKSKASGDVLYLPVQNGQKVVAGSVIARIDSTDALKNIRDAEAGLESAKISLEKLKIQNSEENMNTALVKAYDDGFSTVSDTFLDLPTTLTGLKNLLGNQSLSENAARMSGKLAQDYRGNAEKAYYLAVSAFEKNTTHFNSLNRTSPKEEIDSVINETYETTKLLTDAIKYLRNYVDYLAEDTGKTSDYVTFQNTLSSDTETINGHLNSLLSIKTSIKSGQDAFPNTNLDLQSAQLSVKLKENALGDAKDKLADYSIRAPFDGTLAVVSVKKYDSINSGTTIATLITKKQLAEITLNEVDVAKIKVGQKTTLTFDAIPDLSINGEVAEIDSLGTVTQGVVNYAVKISFDTQDDRVKPGMSTTAMITTDIKENVLIVPNSSIKTQNRKSYVEIFKTELPTPPAGTQGTPSLILPEKITVETGLSNNTQTEITSGLTEGTIVVTKTITGTSAKTATPSILNSVGNRSGGGNPLH